MIHNYDSLKTAIYNWLLREVTDIVVTPDRVDNYISLCESELNRELKIRDLQEAQSLTALAGDDYVTLPNNYQSMCAIQFDTAPYDIKPMSSRADMNAHFTNDTSRPKAFFIFGDKIIFNCVCDGDYTLDLDYYKSIPAISSLNQTNNILTKYPDLYLYGALKQAHLHAKDNEKLTNVGTVYSNAIDRIIAADKVSKLTSGARIRPNNPIGG